MVLCLASQCSIFKVWMGIGCAAIARLLRGDHHEQPGCCSASATVWLVGKLVLAGRVGRNSAMRGGATTAK